MSEHASPSPVRPDAARGAPFAPPPTPTPPLQSGPTRTRMRETAPVTPPPPPVPVAATAAGTAAWPPPYSTAATRAAKPPDGNHQLQTKFSQGSIDTAMIEPRIKVSNPDDSEPNINLYVEDQANPAMQLVSEMMILCGEAVAAFGSDNKLPLPYTPPVQHSSQCSLIYLRGLQGALPILACSVLQNWIFQKKKLYHMVYMVFLVTCSSPPIRRYVDLLAHYQ